MAFRSKVVHVLDPEVRIAIAVNDVEFECEPITGDLVDYRGVGYVIYDIVKFDGIDCPSRFKGDVFIVLQKE